MSFIQYIECIHCGYLAPDPFEDDACSHIKEIINGDGDMDQDVWDRLSYTVDTDNPEECKQLIWGTYGKNGDEPLVYQKLCNLELNHLKNILKIQNIGLDYKQTIEDLIKDKTIIEREEKLKYLNACSH